MAYTYMLVSNFINTVLQKLNDDDGIFTTREEILVYLQEGLDLVNSFTFFQREKVTINNPANQQIFDIRNDINLTTGSRLGFVKTVSDLITSIKYTLLEYDLSSSTINKEVFDNDKFLEIINSKVNALLAETDLIYNYNSYPITAPPVDSYTFNDNFIKLVRLSFTDLNNKTTRIRRENEEYIKSYYRLQSINSGKPKFYSELVSNTRVVNFYPLINIKGNLNSLSTNSVILTLADTIPIPSNLVWILKYGVLAEIYAQNGNGYDPKREDYCRKRWEQGITLAKNYFSVLNLKVNGIPIHFTDLDSLDSYDYNWENKTSSKINNAALVAWNLIAFNRKVNSILGLEFDILSNTILPTLETDYIQLPVGYMQYLYDYVLHIIELKVGDSMFYAGVSKLTEMLQFFSNSNNRLNIPNNLFNNISAKNTTYRDKNSTVI